MKVELSDEEKALMYRKLELSDLTDRISARSDFFSFFFAQILRDVWLTIWTSCHGGFNQVPTYKKPTKK